MDESPCPPGHNTPIPLKRSPPASFKRLLGSAGPGDGLVSAVDELTRRLEEQILAARGTQPHRHVHLNDRPHFGPLRAATSKNVPALACSSTTEAPHTAAPLYTQTESAVSVDGIDVSSAVWTRRMATIGLPSGGELG